MKVCARPDVAEVKDGPMILETRGAKSGEILALNR